jgi:hypothetical protein
MVKTLEELHDRLRSKIPSPAIFQCLNARLIIQLGVNLKDILPEQNEDSALVGSVIETLGRMNIRLEADQ